MAGPNQNNQRDKHHTSVEIADDFVDAISELGDEDGYYDARQLNRDDKGIDDEIIEIEDSNDAFVDSIKAKVKNAFPSPFVRECSIYRVHEKFHKMNDRAYTPEVVSIGPLHHGKASLQAMEECKLLYMHALLSRTAKIKFKEFAEFPEKREEAPKGKIEVIRKHSGPTITEPMSSNIEEFIDNIAEIEEGERVESEIEEVEALQREQELKTTGWLNILEECVASIKRIEKEARKCYLEIVTPKSDEFVEMMLIDGLFIIELFRRSAGEVRKDRYDPIFGKIGDLSSLTRDLLLLENQLPMLVLNCLFKVLSLEKDLKGSSLNMLILRFFNHLMPRHEKDLEKYSNFEGKHLLDLLANTFHPSPPSAEKKRADSWKFIPCLTELKRSGIKFKKGSTKGSFLDIKFSNGELEIPPIIIQDKTDLLFRNLIASEQCSDGRVTYMTSYAFFMDSLIDSADDVGLLCHKGIITNYLGSDEDVSNLFNKLCCEVIIDNFYYSHLCDELNTYYRKRRHIWRATLKRDYFSGPWATVSFIAAFLLLIFTLTGTLFALLSFVIHKS